MNHEKEKQHLVEVVRQTVERDKALREKFGVGDKFRFIKDRLQALLEQVEKYVAIEQIATQKPVKSVGEDEMLIYVYLYNTQGMVLQSWINMLTPKLFYEYSVNRPIYGEKKFIENLIHNKSNRVQHAYLTIIVKKESVLKTETPLVDALQNPMLKIRD